jgi:hypothetical protein
LEVETPNGIVSGGGVVEVTVRWRGETETELAQGHGVDIDSRGEASFVEDAPGKYLFALTVSEPFERTPATMRNSDDAKGGENPAKVLTRRLETSRETRSIPPDKHPVLVTFDDINDPRACGRLIRPISPPRSARALS